MSAEDRLALISDLLESRQLAKAAAASEAALADHPEDERFMRAHAIVLRHAGRSEEAALHLLAVLAKKPLASWAHAQLGVALQGRDHRRCLVHLRRALELEPNSLDYRLALVHALARHGDDDGGALEEAYQLLRPALPGASAWRQNDLHIAFHVLSRVCAFDEMGALGRPMDIGQKWAEAGNHTALLLLLGRVQTPGDRDRLMDLHRVAVRGMEEVAARSPVS